ncbi:MAG: HlyD family efflux transporter periplasmic adaptor subunit [Deltaproteobacteria bacterium]|nr:HlyD family efflux transporter periplasmic adaptor subunit [Deltaproteobacteria bacterium]
MATPVLHIDPRDYQLEITRQQATLKKAQAALALEQGQQGVAQHEWQMFLRNNESVSESAALALREPYLRQAEAEVSSAQAGLGQAQLALERTVIQLPFDALVLSKEVDLGAQLVAQGVVATLAATDTFWLEVSIPVAQLPWLELPGVNSSVGAQAQVTTPSLTHPRIGRVVRLLGNLEEGGRMARLLIAINDPLDKSKPLGQRQPLLLGDYVDVMLNGRDLNDVVVLSRNAVHDGNRVWVAQADNTLTIRTVEILWKDRTKIYIGGDGDGGDGLQSGDQVIVSDLSAAVEGMAIRIDRPVESSIEAQ